MKRFALLLLTALSLVSNAEAQQLLRQGTAATVKVGPFLDASDGATAEDSLTISQADIRLSKNGGAFAQSNDDSGATHDENGWYDVPLDEDDTDTLGRLTVAIAESGALPVWAEFEVVPANVYDSLRLGTDYLATKAPGVTFVAHDGNDSDSGNALETAVEAASAGDIIIATAGTYALGSDAIAIPDGVTLRGAGMHDTVITSTTATAAAVEMNDATRLEHLTVSPTTAAGAGTASSGTCIGAVISHCRLNGTADAYIHNTEGASLVVLEHCLLESNFDVIAHYGAGSADNVRIYANDCVLRVRGSNAAHGYQGIALYGGSAIATRCAFDIRPVDSSAVVTAGVRLYSSGARATIIDSTIITSNTAGTVLDLSVIAGRLEVSNTQFDTAKVAGTIVETGVGKNITALDAVADAVKVKTDYLPSATAGTNGGIPTVDGNNRIAGIQGTITTLDALDTAQDTQHGTTLAAISDVEAKVDTAIEDVGTLQSGFTTFSDKFGDPVDTTFSDDIANIKAVADLVLEDTGTTLPGIVAEGAAGILTDVDQEAVPTSRTIVLVETADGLVDERTAGRSLTIGHPRTFAIDFRNDSAINDRVITVESVAIVDGAEGGVTFDAYGRDRTQAKVRVSGVTAGVYVIRVVVTYLGGAQGVGEFTLRVSE